MSRESGHTQAALRFQYGIKFATAGVLALYGARWLRLDTPSWALTTVAVLMVAQYVGAMVEKALFRLVGTIIGALLGIALVGNFFSDGPLFLTLLFIFLTFFNYMVGGKRAPYAFLLCSMTMLIVIGGSMFAPETAWDVGLSRTMDIGLGIIVTLIVSTVLWPRHARVEFRQLAIKMLYHLEQAAQEAERSLHPSGNHPKELVEIETEHFKDIDFLQKLMLFGARESPAFATRVPSYNIIVDRIDHMHPLFMTLARTGHSKSVFTEEIKKELSALLFAVENECGLFRKSLTEQLPPAGGNLESAYEKLIYRIQVLRKSANYYGISDFVSFAGFVTGFLELAAHLNAIRVELVRLFTQGYYQPASPAKKQSWFAVDPAHTVLAFKGSLTAIFAIIFCNWLRPPGAEIIPTASWLFIMLPRTYFYGKQGQKSIHYASLIGLVGISILLLFTLIAPWIGYYFGANIFLSLSFFLLGWAYFEHVGVFTQILYALVLAITGAVSLCKDWPPPPNGFQNWYFGIVVSFGICALVQRVVWPPLPQNEFFRTCRRYFSECLTLLPTTPFSNADSTIASPYNMLQIIWNTGRWVNTLPARSCTPQERQRLHEFLAQMHSAGYQLIALSKLAHHKNTKLLLSEFFTPVKEALHLDLSECRLAFEDRRTPPPPSPTRSDPTEHFHSLYQTLRYETVLKVESTAMMMDVLGTLFRLEAAASAAWRCRQLVSTLQLENYARDVAM